MESAPQRVSDLWFEDANIIFQAGNSLFRVHQGILQARSSIFRDMFSMPQNANPSDLVDGCIFIHLPDAAEDIRCFFLAIGYDASFFEPPPSEHPLSVILAITRLSHKYDVPFLRRRGLSHLSTRSPTSLDDFFNLLKMEGSEFQWPPIGEELQVLETALEIGASWVLPCQLLGLWSGDFDEILVNQRWKNLECEIQRMCLVNWRHLEISMRCLVAKTMEKLHSGLCDQCTDLGWKLQAHAVFILSSRLSNFFNIFGCMKRVREYCPACRRKSTATLIEALGLFWDSLPKTFNLPPWATLEIQKKEDTSDNTSAG